MIKPLLVWLRNNFGFSKTETNGFIILIPVMIFLLFAPTLYTAIFSKSYENSITDKAKLDSILTLWNENVKPIKNGLTSKKEVPEIIINLQPFNPNTADKDLLITVGIPPFLAQRIMNYRNKGGGFKLKNDLSKIYDFPDSLFSVLEPFILLPKERIALNATKVTELKSTEEDLEKDKFTSKRIEEKTLINVNINLADTTVFKTLRGIGPVYAGRIMKYRTLLGGFISVNQLTEVYGISDSLVLSLHNQLQIQESFLPKKLKINISSFKQLLAHPYITYEQAGDILNTKSKYGKFKNNSDLENLSLFTKQELDKLIPYLSF